MVWVYYVYIYPKNTKYEKLHSQLMTMFILSLGERSEELFSGKYGKTVYMEKLVLG